MMKKLMTMKYATNLFKYVVALSIMMSTTALFAQESSAIPDKHIYEKMGISPTTLAAIMIVFTCLLVVFVVVLLGAVKNIAEYKHSKTKDKLKSLLFLIGLLLAPSAFGAGETTAASEYVISFPDSAFWTFVGFDVLLVLIIVYLTGIVRGFTSEYRVPDELNFFARWNKKMTDSVPLEQEESITMDHDYDGIKELDNNLPPWWKYGFYITIAWGGIYLFYYHVLQAGPLQEEEYITEMEEGEREVAAYKLAHPVLITPDNVTLLTDEASMAQGQEIYTTYCQTCHMEKGRGGSGPNLTDSTWIYGGDIKTVFTTISEGTANGMSKWIDIIKAEEIQSVASYVIQLEPVLPPEGKFPEGKIQE